MPKTNEEKSKQHRRTHANKVRKYTKLIAEFPIDKQFPKWKSLLEFSKSQL